MTREEAILFLEMSHDDYDKALQVEFLCVTCHRRKDAANVAA